MDDRTTVEVFELHGHTYVKGDQIMVKPSQSRHRDGFIARVISAELDEAGTVIAVNVYGAPGKKAPLVRTLRSERLAPMVTRRRRPFQQPSQEPS